MRMRSAAAIALWCCRCRRPRPAHACTLPPAASVDEGTYQEYCSIGPDGKRIKLTLGEKEQLFLEALSVRPGGGGSTSRVAPRASRVSCCLAVHTLSSSTQPTPVAELLL